MGPMNLPSVNWNSPSYDDSDKICQFIDHYCHCRRISTASWSRESNSVRQRREVELDNGVPHGV
jgi:hypothetical protein